MHQSNQKTDDLPSPWLALAALPALLALWCCLSVLQKRTSDIPAVGTLFSTVGMVLAGVLLIQVIVRLITRNRVLADMLTLLVVSFVGLHGPVSGIFAMGYQAFDKSMLLIVWSAVHTVALAGLFLLAKKKLLVQRMASAAAIAMTLMVGLQTAAVLLPLLGDSFLIDDLDRLVDRESPIDPNESLVEDESATPDIYYLIVDAYARQDILNEIYDFDNSDFIESLQERGFYVGSESRSNYDFTEYSLASSLNMRHLSEFNLSTFQTRMPLRHLIRESSVVKALKSSGYRTCAIETGKSETECDNFDRYAAFSAALNDFQDVLYHGTPLPRLLSWTGLIRSAARRHGDRVLFAFDQVSKLAAESSDPAFVFCHVLAPHPPFLFDDEGNEVEFRGHYLLADCRNFTSCYDYDMDVYRKQYREQVTYINSKLIQMIDQIQSSDRPSVIILQADHGPRLGRGFERDGEPTCEWRFREAFSILNAIAMPDQRNSAFYPSMTPVNSFRMVFNELFGTQLPSQPDDSYTVKRYEYTPVTAEAMSVKPVVDDFANHLSKPTANQAAGNH